ncbi:MAG: SIMPL domain-containing protein [bacterium]|nr:SIMPL domain-containing protein [bacterium]
MEGLKVLRNTQVIILGLCIAVATILSSVILSQGFMKIKKFSNEVISVTGSAEKKIKSDYIVWKSGFFARNADLTAAFAKLKEDLKTAKQYLIDKGIKEEEITVSQVDTKVLYKKNEKGHDTNEVEGYKLTQAMEVKSYDIDLIDTVSRESTELINKGIEFISVAPEYFYTKLSNLKIEMLEKATDNAKTRAEAMAKSTGNSIGLMRAAKMGVFQITPVNSYDVSWYGSNDTKSLDKKVTAVVTVEFAIKE